MEPGIAFLISKNKTMQLSQNQCRKMAKNHKTYALKFNIGACICQNFRLYGLFNS